MAALLLWVYYSSQILLFGAEFTQVYADYFGAHVVPDEHAVRVEQKEIEKPGTWRISSLSNQPPYVTVTTLFPRRWLTQLSKQAAGSIGSRKATRSMWI